jgi:multidrug transporter EmrE-like cation transporter
MSDPMSFEFETHPEAHPTPATEPHAKRRLLVLIALILLSVALAATAQLVLKAGMDRVGEIGRAEVRSPVQTVLRAAQIPAVWAGLALFGMSAAVWLVVLSRAQLSFAYPFASLTYVVILLADRFLLKQNIPGLRWAGVLFIVTGIILVSRTPHA